MPLLPVKRELYGRRHGEPIVIDLSKPRTNVRVAGPGWYQCLSVLETSGEVAVSFVSDGETWPLHSVAYMEVPYRELYLSNDAQPGCHIVLVVSEGNLLVTPRQIDVSLPSSRLVTWAAGDVYSTPLDIGRHKLSAISLDAQFAAASLSVQAWAHGAWQDVYDDAQNEVVIQGAAPSRTIGIDRWAGTLAALRQIRFRSGTAAVPAPQAAASNAVVWLKV